MKGKKIFLSGGTGFFGKSILSMRKRGFLTDTELVILSRNPQPFAGENPEFDGISGIRFIQGDIRSFPFPEEDFDYIIHAAAPSGTPVSPEEERSIILDGTARIIRFARQSQVQKLLFTSSGAVYGPQPPELEQIPEEFPCNPVTGYGKAKLEAERMCLDSGIFTLLPRCFTFTGPYLKKDGHFAIGNFIRNAMNGEDIVIKSDGRPVRSYLYADDLVKWLFTILQKGENGRPCNVGSDRALSLKDLAHKVADCFSSVPAVKILGTPENTPAPRYVPSIQRAKQELGLRVETGLTESIIRTAASPGMDTATPDSTP